MEKQKILVVDDDKHIAELISLYMMKEGYETRRFMMERKLPRQWKTFSLI